MSINKNIVISEIETDLRNYKKALEKFSRCSPNKADATFNLTSSYTSLRDKLNSKKFGPILIEASNSLDKNYKVTTSFKDKEWDKELSLSNKYGFSKNSSKKLLKDSGPVSVKEIQKPTVQAMLSELDKSYHTCVTDITKARNLDKRAKNIQKRKLGRLFYDVIWGTGAIVTNSILGGLFSASYAYGAPLLYKAGKRYLFNDKL